MKVLAAAVLLLSVTSCTITCTLEAKAGITVLVVDSLSGGTISAESVTVVAREGTFRDSVQVPRSLTDTPVLLAIERAGNYRVEVSADGYRPWALEPVQVTEDECHVRPMALTARLQPL